MGRATANAAPIERRIVLGRGLGAVIFDPQEPDSALHEESAGPGGLSIRVQADEVALAVKEESHSFEVFFQREYPKLVRLLFGMNSDLAEAEDLAQDAMSRTWERWERVGQMDSPAGYTYRAALNLQRKRIRHLSVRARRLPLIRPTQPMQPHVSGEVVSALAMLPPGQRAAVLLIEWIGMPVEEAASILGVTAAGVRTRIHRARQALRRSMEDENE